MSETELSVIATVLEEGTPEAFNIVAQQLKSHHFQEPRYRHAWKVMESQAKQGFSVNIPALAKNWNSKTHAPPGIDFVQAVENEAYPNLPICVNEGVPTILDAYITTRTNALVDAYASGDLGPRELCEALEKALSDQGSMVIRRESREVVEEFIKNASDPSAFVSAGSPFGAKLLDLEYGTYNIIGARPSVGKTALSMNYLSHLAEKDTCLYVTAEMSSTALMRRFASCKVNIVLQDLKRPDKGILEQMRAFSEHPIHKNIRWADFSDSKCYIEDLVGMIDDSARTQGTRIVIIDYVQQLHARERFTRRRDEVASISNQLKKIGKKHGLILVVLAQLRRPESTQRNRRPRIDDLAECCDLEQDADQIILVHRGYLEKEGKYEDEGELIVGKARDSETGKVDVVFESRYCRFALNVEPILNVQDTEPEEDPFA